MEYLKTYEIVKSLREMAFIMYRLGDLQKQKVLEAAADRLESLKKKVADARRVITDTKIKSNNNGGYDE